MSANILIVDDLESIRNILTTVLEREGYEVVTAADGHEAMEKVKSSSIDLAVVDINIPGPDGLEILKHIKRSSLETEVIMMSGYTTIDTAIEALRQGACDYIVKPFDIDTITDTIRRGIEKQKQASETRQLMYHLEQQTFELAVLCELREAIGYALDYREFVEPIMDSLRKIIDHDASAFLFMTGGDSGELTVWVKRGMPIDMIQQVRSNMVNAYNSVSVNSVSEDMVRVYVGEAEEYISEEEESSSELRSFLNVALVIKDKAESRLAGMISISSCRRNAFDLGTSRLFYNIANHMTNALERLTRILAGEKNKLEMMVRSMTDGVIMFDQRGHIAILNPAARRMLKLGEIVNAEHLARRMGDTRLFRTLDGFLNHNNTNGSILGENGFEEEIFVEKSEKYLSASVAPIKVDDGEIHGVVAVLRDVTRRKEMDDAKSSFVSSVSHELRTPLTAIRNAITIIEMAGEVNEQQEKFLSMSIRNIDRLGRLINTILDFSRLDTGSLKMDFGLVDMKALAQQCIADLQNLAVDKSIEVTENIPDNLPQIYADHNRLEQVFTNIVENGIKYSLENGQISIDARIVDPPSVNGKLIAMPRNLPSPGFLEVSIADTGIGISDEDQEHIFGRFVQVGKSYGAGVGLGLAIVKQIIEKHYGEIWVESELGEGSKFSFILPVDKKCGKILNLIRAIDREIETAKADQSSFSLLLTRIEGSEDVNSNGKGGDAEERLADIADYIQNNTHTKETMMYSSGDCGLLFSLYEGDRQAVKDVEDLISRLIFQQNSTAEDPSMELSGKTWIATYPDDGVTAVELIDELAAKCVPQLTGQLCCASLPR